MFKLSKLSDKEVSEPLNGSYRITLDIHVDASDKNTTLDSFREIVSSLGESDILSIEKYSRNAYLNVGDTVELISPIKCQKTVYRDSQQNYVITDKLMSKDVTPVGEAEVFLEAGTVAEINKKIDEDNAEILFTGTAIDIGSNKMAYLGILELPCDSIQKYQVQK